MKPVFLTVVLSMLPLHLTEGFIDCRTACRKCKDGTEDLDLLEVYCSMCKECRDKRRELLASQTTTPIDPFPEDPPPVTRRNPVPFRTRTFYRRAPALRTDVEDDARLATWPDNCPTPPYCDDPTPAPVPPPTKPPTKATAAPPTCPPIDKCRPRPHTECVPCVSECPCPFPSEININVNLNEKKVLRADTTVPMNDKNNSPESSDSIVVDTKLFKKLLMSFDHRKKENKHNTRDDSDNEPNINMIIRRANDIVNSNDDDNSFNKETRKKTKTTDASDKVSINAKLLKLLLMSYEHLTKVINRRALGNSDIDPDTEMKTKTSNDDNSSSDSVFNKETKKKTDITVPIPFKRSSSDTSDKVSIDAKLLKMFLMSYDHLKKVNKNNAVGNSISDPETDMMVKRTQNGGNSKVNSYNVRNVNENIIKNGPDDHFTSKTYVDNGPNFQNTMQDQDYFYIYLGVPKNLPESQSATTPMNVSVTGFPPLKIF